ncbi:hypothetical protein VPH35_118389 [Triticum aestivum]
MPQVALEVTLFPPLAGVAAAPPSSSSSPLELLPPPGCGCAAPASRRGRHVPLVLVLLDDLVAGGGKVRGQVGGAEGERGQGLAGRGRIGGQCLASVLPNEQGATGA